MPLEVGGPQVGGEEPCAQRRRTCKPSITIPPVSAVCRPQSQHSQAQRMVSSRHPAQDLQAGQTKPFSQRRFSK